jgi:hypothetical protein
MLDYLSKFFYRLRCVCDVRLGSGAVRHSCDDCLVGHQAGIVRRSILLTDELIRTGATVGNCARTLLTASTCRTEVLTLVRAI